MLSSLTIKNFKSIVDLRLELGRFNVLIGENGCGKSNILEALAMAAGAAAGRLENEDLFLRGMRIARPSLMANAFSDRVPAETVELSLGYPVPGEDEPSMDDTRLRFRNGRWEDTAREERFQRLRKMSETYPTIAELLEFITNAHSESLTDALRAIKEQGGESARLLEQRDLPRSYAIFCADTLALRGLSVQSRHEPLGLYGEGLDVAIAGLSPELRAELIEHARVISWLDDIDVDTHGARKLEGYKLGRSLSDLYFADRFLAADNRIFSAENANEGILHLLFHLVLFLHPETPRLFAIDNLETALNPHLLRHLVKTLVKLAAAHDRQALVTTHNPAALDGLNLHDDAQRLFVVYRDDEGHTQARRVLLKPDASVDGAKLKLSELWMRGMLGGIPTHF